MKYRFLIVAFTLVLAVGNMAGQKKSNILSLKESITDNAIVYPSSFEADTKQMMDDWYLKNYAIIDENSINSYQGEVSDAVYKERLRKLPTSIEMPYNQIVKSYIERYVKRGRTLVAQLLAMSRYYMPIFEEALERNQMPLELKYIPIIESALNPNAISPAGAGGLWQFMPATAKGNGLEVSSAVDERRDPYKSSEKAALFFKKLYNTYNDWSLAIAAYNCGPGNVNKAIRRAGTENPDFWEIYNYLPKETRGYVPAFIAANYVMTYYNEHGISPTMTKKPLIVDTVHINRKVTFRQISSVLNIPIEEIRILNPQYRNDVIPGNVHPYSLALPTQQIYSYIAAKDKIYHSSGYSAASDDDNLASTDADDHPYNYTYIKDGIEYHDAIEGESWYDIAMMANVKAEEMARLNGYSEYDVIKPTPGQHIIISRNPDEKAQKDLAMNKTNYRESETDKNGRDMRDVPPAPAKQQEREQANVPERRKVDSYNRQNNGRDNYDQRQQSAQNYAKNDNYDSDYEARRLQQQEQERKRREEAAAKKKRQQEEIAAAKKRQEEAAKKKRQEEYKKKKEEEKRKQQEEAAAKKKKEEEERKRREAAKPITHEVKEGNNLTKLAQQYGVSVEDIKKANPGLKDDQIRIGQKLNIPKKGQKAAATQQQQGKQAASSSKQQSTKKETPAAKQQPAKPSTYTVKEGNNLSKIAAQHGVSVSELKKANPGINEDKIKPGQKLNIPKKK